ncbi:MAG: bifunctional 23S rRNA (guanine(2069)-N(7))-methyltransferase RlmK/23S rRNA (guanine(2445)-N(2))-methyltransferase RlmL [Eggerthellaceae bacterium]|nr:bifunctional 23S rRNA (guanine(2069)-N(7))-methyltransferase RlmK/23S rRNA (guanine(2445)-N(2))-methyltransferase RlmL [Eggerthellaceae bacterium]
MSHVNETNEYEFFASCLPGCEQLLADELRAMRVRRVRPLGGGVAFFGDARCAMRVCLWSRLAARVMLVVGRVNAGDADLLYAGAYRLAWESVLAPGASISVHAHGTNAELRNTKFTALKIKDAVCDRVRERRGQRPDVNTLSPDLTIDVRVNEARATVSVDLSGESLHKRTYLGERDGSDAPLSCAHAAALLAAAGWKARFAQGGGLFDPVCGEGFVVCEAAGVATDCAPGLLRDRWGFFGWLGFDEETWDELLAEADERFDSGLSALLGQESAKVDAKSAPDSSTVRIVGVSASSPSVARAREHLRAAGLRQVASVEAANADDAGEVLSRVCNVVSKRAGKGLLVASAIPVDRDDADARAVSETAAFMAAAKGALPESSFVFAGTQSLGCHFGLEPAFSAKIGRGRIEARMEVYEQAPAAMCAITLPDSAGGADHVVEVHDEQASQFAARLRKVVKERRKWAKREGVSCYRVYDADLPDYAVAIDVYEGAAESKGKTFVHVAEYQAPSSVDAAVARRRFDDVLAVVPVVLGVRPDHVFSKVREKSKGGEQYRNAGRRSYVAHTAEGGRVFEIDLAGYLDTGIFLDHRTTRLMVGDMARGKRFLNLFAYTGTATVHAAAGGARHTTTVDLSQTYLDWARRNMEENGFTGPDHVFERGDCMEWIRDARRAGKSFDLIFVDPPTFSNSKAMGKRTWDVQRDHVELLVGVSRLLAKGGVAVFSCNLRNFKPDVEELARLGVELEDIAPSTIPHDFERNPKIHKCYLVRRIFRN